MEIIILILSSFIISSWIISKNQVFIFSFNLLFSIHTLMVCSIASFTEKAITWWITHEILDLYYLWIHTRFCARSDQGEAFSGLFTVGGPIIESGRYDLALPLLGAGCILRPFCDKGLRNSTLYPNVVSKIKLA